MQYIHVVNGEVAGATLKQALAQAGRPDSVVVLRDDLAVGPLVDVDSVAMARSGFWQRVAPNSNIDFAAEMRDALASLADLRDATTEVAIWHGQSASDQLMLRRVAFHLHQSPQRINEVGMDVRELEAPNGQGPLTTIGMYSGARLARRFSTIAPVSVLRIGRLAYEWQQTVRENADTRLWKGNTLVPVSYGTVDEVILSTFPPTGPAHGTWSAASWAPSTGCSPATGLSSGAAANWSATASCCCAARPIRSAPANCGAM